MIRFMRFKWLYFLISALVLVPGIFSLIRFGLNPSIDFTGGTILELSFEKDFDEEASRQIDTLLKEKGYETAVVTSSGKNTFLLRLPPIDKDEASTIKALLAQDFQEMPEEVRFETVGPTLGKELLKKTAMAILLAAGFILGFVAWAFKDAKFGVCAILAMFHDSLVMLGTFSILGHFLGVEIDTLFVTALLTILSFSVHDTVVVYDRIRESQRNFPSASFVDLADKAVTETLARSLNNSMTIVFMLLALLLLGGGTVRFFILALLLGTISGTYSSAFTAVPLLVVWGAIEEKRKRI